MKIKYLNIIFPGLILLAGCTYPPAPGSSASTSGGSPVPPNPEVNFNLSIDKSVFAPDAEIKVSLYDAVQLKLAEESASCSLSFDPASKKETVTCPAGVEYKPATPEAQSFKLSEISNIITFRSSSVTVGEKYRLQVSGKYRDNCNTASASAEGTAKSNAEIINLVNYANTDMACAP